MRTILDGRASAEHAVLALGMFDGVHIGHRVLVEKARVLARRRNVPLVVCTFVSHPMTLIAPEKCPPMLTTFDEKAALLEKLGVDMLYAMPFDREMMNMPPEDYVGELVRHFHPTDLVCGYNHSFGKAGKGNPELLHAIGDALGFQTAVVPKITLGGQEVSSTAVRGLLGRGEVALARKLLARPYARLATVKERANDRCALVMPPNGKQDVAAGRYRALLEGDGATWPVSLSVRHAGEAECQLPAALQTREEVTLHFVSER